MYDVTEDGCTLRWKPPEGDGGVKVSHYIIERRDVTRSDWQGVGETGDCSKSVTKLQAKHSYFFRVFAVNKVGVSEPTQTRDPTLAKNPYGI